MELKRSYFVPYRKANNRCGFYEWMNAWRPETGIQNMLLSCNCRHQEYLWSLAFATRDHFTPIVWLLLIIPLQACMIILLQSTAGTGKAAQLAHKLSCLLLREVSVCVFLRFLLTQLRETWKAANKLSSQRYKKILQILKTLVTCGCSFIVAEQEPHGQGHQWHVGLYQK